MPNYVLLITDNPERSAPVAEQLGQWLHVKMVALSDYAGTGDLEAYFLLIDIDLSDRKIIDRLKNNFEITSSAKDKIFLISGKFPSKVYQANALGAASTLPSCFEKIDIDKIMRRYAITPEKNKGHGGAEATRRALNNIQLLNDNIYEAVSSNEPLPRAQILSSCDGIMESLRHTSIGSFLETIRQYDSYTYRHCMTVSGIAVAFAMDLGMRSADVRRISTGALLHDIGKVRIPLSILDKPGALSAEERVQINKHPGYGAEILRRDGQFNDEVVDITLHHHELLDGSGYPDGLSGDQITDPVRIITVVDIYSALIDNRAYRDAVTPGEAYQILLDMGAKLDRDILGAFETIALTTTRSPARDAPAPRAMAS